MSCNGALLPLNIDNLLLTKWRANSWLSTCRFFWALINSLNALLPPESPSTTKIPRHAVFIDNVIIQLNPFTVFIHVHFQTLFQTARSALVSVSFVDWTTALDRENDRERKHVRVFGWVCLSVNDGFLIIFMGDQSSGERSRYYRVVIDLHPCSASAASSWRISILSCRLLHKSSPSCYHIRLDYTCYIMVFSPTLNGRGMKLVSSRET